MIRYGKYNTLRVVRNVDFGAYLTDPADPKTEILLPARYIDKPLQAGEEIDVFVYRDSEDRPIATTEHPFAEVGEFAYLQVTDVNRIGAFLDWGITAKDLLLPFSEQKVRLSQGMVALVYVYLDNATQRIVASAKIDKWLGNVLPEYKRGDCVKALVYKRTDLGYKAIVDNAHHGFIYENQLYAPLVIGETVKAYVKQVRPDGKIDLTLSGSGDGRIEALSDRIAKRLAQEPDCYLPVGDSTSPEAIKAMFSCSKKDFKKAIGHLYREKKILIEDGGIRLSLPEKE